MPTGSFAPNGLGLGCRPCRGGATGGTMRGVHFGVARHVGLALLLTIATTSAPVFAQSKGILDEAKVGVLAHDVGIFGSNVEKGAEVNGEVLFTSPDILKVIGTPRPTVGAAWNTAKK